MFSYFQIDQIITVISNRLLSSHHSIEQECNPFNLYNHSTNERQLIYSGQQLQAVSSNYNHFRNHLKALLHRVLKH